MSGHLRQRLDCACFSTALALHGGLCLGRIALINRRKMLRGDEAAPPLRQLLDCAPDPSGALSWTHRQPNPQSGRGLPQSKTLRVIQRCGFLSARRAPTWPQYQGIKGTLPSENHKRQGLAGARPSENTLTAPRSDKTASDAAAPRGPGTVSGQAGWS